MYFKICLPQFIARQIGAVKRNMSISLKLVGNVTVFNDTFLVHINVKLVLAQEDAFGISVFSKEKMCNHVGLQTVFISQRFFIYQEIRIQFICFKLPIKIQSIPY